MLTIFYIDNRECKNFDEFNVLKLHRDKNCQDGIGPAYFHTDREFTMVLWCKHGDKHSLIGPAFYVKNGKNYFSHVYYINDCNYENFHHTKLLNL